MVSFHSPFKTLFLFVATNEEKRTQNTTQIDTYHDIDCKMTEKNVKYKL